MNPSGRTYAPLLPWQEFHTRRWFSLTADQDWAPDWAMEYFIDWARGLGVPIHVFATNASAALAASAQRGEVSVGWHPNFAPGSTHGENPQEIISHLRTVAPHATTFRTHGFAESYQALLALAAAGHRVESQFPTRFSAGITPLVHASGLIRLPVWFEDDIWMRDPDDADRRVRDTADSPGLKILNLHPIHIALNSPDFAYYDSRRAEIYAEGKTTEDLAYEGRGARTVAEEIIDAAKADEEFVAFTELAARASEIHEEADLDA